jgi:predicted DNA-binding transcriptional regulator AlpA
MKSKIEILNYRVDEVASVLGISIATVWRWSKQSQIAINSASTKNFPMPKKLSTKVTIWNAKAIQEWNEKQQVA